MRLKQWVALALLALLVSVPFLLGTILELIPWTAGELRSELLWRYRRAELLWHFKVDDDFFRSSPTVVEGVMYGLFDDHVKALDAATGKLFWSHEAPAGYRAEMAMVDGVVYLANPPFLDTLDASTGTLLRRFELGGSEYAGALAVDENVVYLDTDRWGLIALELGNGNILWSFPTEYSSEVHAVAGGVIYVGTLYQTVYALDAASGELLWDFWPRDTSSSSSPFAEGPDSVGMISRPAARPFAFITPLRVEDAAPASRHPLSFPPPSTYIAVAGGVVYAGAWDGRLYALDAVSGSPLWSVSVGEMRSAPTVVDNVLYVGSSSGVFGYVSAFDAASGEHLWRYGGFEDRWNTISTPVVEKGAVYACSDRGNVYALDAATGKLLWSYRVAEGSPYAPVVVDGVFYVATSLGHLYALSAASGE